VEGAHGGRAQKPTSRSVRGDLGGPIDDYLRDGVPHGIFNRPLRPGTLPHGLRILHVGTHFDQPIPARQPPTLPRLHRLRRSLRSAPQCGRSTAFSPPHPLLALLRRRGAARAPQRLRRPGGAEEAPPLWWSRMKLLFSEDDEEYEEEAEEGDWDCPHCGDLNHSALDCSALEYDSDWLNNDGDD
jgi:hypothetical protein